ncbi:type II secretion system protein [Pseudoalteromonas sp. JBTF-M23]|uniref:Type II secretion system protein n=1 Tax=Pseudoalteromonas caenipelagi TaxID=2726988 RepID=A0A849VEJ0_9GAMM|nr:type II secretion system protein [Pseudoalteromonas caenipelagi]NOU51812.1 type II secretion system protein [Pseudoalteromonas caenipelagi]
MMSRFKTNVGFSLIELMIVLAIMSVVMGLTGGLVINIFEKNKRHVELEKVRNLFKVYSYRAYYSGQDTQIQLIDGRAIISTQANSNQQIIEFDTLQFVADLYTIDTRFLVQPRSFGIFVHEQPRFYGIESVLMRDE